jgi:hypothetical protein
MVVPPEWEPMLVSAGITPEEIAENQDVSISRFCKKSFFAF